MSNPILEVAMCHTSCLGNFRLPALTALNRVAASVIFTRLLLRSTSMPYRYHAKRYQWLIYSDCRYGMRMVTEDSIFAMLTK